MAYWGDYHTHTVYSHGKGSIEDNVVKAIEAGLKEIAITDHGFRHITYNVNRNAYPKMQEEVQALRKKYPQINVYLGLETNLVSRKGTTDIFQSDVPMLDLIVCGYHKLVKSDNLADYWKMFLPNFVSSITKAPSIRLKNRNTDAYIKAIERYDIDILSHLNNGISSHAVEVAKACAFYGTYVELNGKGNYLTDGEIENMIAEGVQFICDSDAHSPERVGEVSKPQAIVDRLKIPYEQIANWEKLPRFRSRIRKKLYE